MEEILRSPLKTFRRIWHRGVWRAVLLLPLLGFLLAQSACEDLLDESDPRLIVGAAVHNAPVLDLVFSPNGKMLLSAGADNTLRVWDLSGVPHGSSGQTCPEYNPDCFETTSLQPGETGRSLFLVEEHDIRAIAFDPGGVRLAVATHLYGLGDCVKLIGFRTRTPIATLGGFAGKITRLAFSPGGDILAVAGGLPYGPGELHIWNAKPGTYTHFRSLEGCTHTVSGLRFSPDGRFIAASCQNGEVFAWRTADWEQVFHAKGTLSPANDLDFHPTRPVLAGAGFIRNRGGAVALWDIESGRELTTFGGIARPLRSLRFSGDGTRVIAGSEDSRVLIWELFLPSEDDEALQADGGKTFESMGAYLITSMRGHRGPVNVVALSASPLRLASGGSDGLINLWATNGLGVAPCAGDDPACADGDTDEDGDYETDGDLDPEDEPDGSDPDGDLDSETEAEREEENGEDAEEEEAETDAAEDADTETQEDGDLDDERERESEDEGISTRRPTSHTDTRATTAALKEK